MSAPTDFDSGKTEAFAGRFLTALNNGALCLMVSICHRTGLFYVMSQSPPATSGAEGWVLWGKDLFYSVER